MKRTPITDLKARLSHYLDQVRQGREVIITDRGRAVAKITPIKGTERAESRREVLVRSGLLRPPAAKLGRGFWSTLRGEDPSGRGLAALLEERRESR